MQLLSEPNKGLIFKKMFRIKTVIVLCLFVACKQVNNQTNNPAQCLSSWSEGMLDIHHINTGRGDAAYFIFPDGTTMLFDAGVMNMDHMKTIVPLKVSSLQPSDSLTPGGWINYYIKRFSPAGKDLEIDYAVISHFHSDHYGWLNENSQLANNGQYRLTGITEVGADIKIGTLVDRAYPNYDYPLDLETYNREDSTFQNYLAFVKYQVKSNNMKAASLLAGSKDQIVMKNNPGKFKDFCVQNIKCNGSIWTGEYNNSYEFLSKDSIVDSNGVFNENQLSLALKISYGKFDYFTGGDLTGLKGFGLPAWFDVETPVAKAVGQVEVSTMNHHGVRDAMNDYFVKTLNPQVFVQQSHTSDHPGQDSFYRMNSLNPKPDFFATNIHDETMVTYGPWFKEAYKSVEGHIVIRVLPPGDDYYVYILDSNSLDMGITAEFGPYKCR